MGLVCSILVNMSVQLCTCMQCACVQEVFNTLQGTVAWACVSSGSCTCDQLRAMELQGFVVEGCSNGSWIGV